MMFIKEYGGNLTLIPNGTERLLEKSTKLREGFKRMAQSATTQGLTSDSDDSDDDTEVLAFQDFDLSSKRDSLSSGRTSLASVFGVFDDSNSRDSVASSSSSLTDGSLSDEVTSSYHQRKKLRAIRPAASTSSVTQGVQKLSITSRNEASQQPPQPGKRGLAEREKANSQEPLIDKENIGQSPARKKKPASITPFFPSS